MSPCNRFELPRRIFFDSYQNATNDAAPKQEQHRGSVGQFECRLGGARSVSFGRSQDRPAPQAFLRSGDDHVTGGQGCVGVGATDARPTGGGALRKFAPKVCI
jgi:hypothetical protein